MAVNESSRGCSGRAGGSFSPSHYSQCAMLVEKKSPTLRHYASISRAAEAMLEILCIQEPIPEPQNLVSKQISKWIPANASASDVDAKL